MLSVLRDYRVRKDICDRSHRNLARVGVSNANVPSHGAVVGMGTFGAGTGRRSGMIRALGFLWTRNPRTRVPKRHDDGAQTLISITGSVDRGGTARGV